MIPTYLGQLLSLLLLCCTWPLLSQHSTTPAPAHADQVLGDAVRQSAIFSRGHTGFVLYDPSTDEMLCDVQGSLYFTPASNTKIFTLYAAQRLLADSLPLLHYAYRGDTLLFWGAANPLLLHPDFPPDTTALAFLARHPGPLAFSGSNFEDDRFGEGWMWDDYAGSYQTEKCPLPLYGNMVRIAQEDGALRTVPPLARVLLAYRVAKPGERPGIRRQEFANVFEHNAPLGELKARRRDLPYRYSPEWAAALLSDTLRRAVLVSAALRPTDARTLYALPTDTLYRRLMHDSDNFVAEQLLLMCSDRLFGVQQSKKAIDYAKEQLLADMPDKLLWYDGSGLSRYGMFTPRSVVAVLKRLRDEMSQERLYDIFPAGGTGGTLRGLYYGPAGVPYLYAKTGTLRNTHCLSGYLLTSSGRTLIFSFMHNNFPHGPTPLKEEMEKVLGLVVKNY